LSQGTRNRGRLQIEISAKDADVLEQLAPAIPYNSRISKRTRSTNFAPEYTSVTLRVCAREFREELVALGMKVGRKSETIEAPRCEFSQADYFRGVVDGDGSLGFTSNGFPFLSLCTASEKLAAAYESFVRGLTGKEKRLKRNARDRMFNHVVFKEDAQAVAAALYYEGCVAIERKKQAALAVQAWRRPDGMHRVFSKEFWTDEQDSYILTHNVEESAVALRRTEQSVKMRLWRLRGSNK
jgi:hypothetical protein